MNKYKNIFIILFVGIILISSGCDSKNNNNDIVESTNEENNNQVGNTTNTTNSYQIFADNLKEEISTFTSSTYNYQYVQSDCINDGYAEYNLETKQLTPMTEEEFISMIVYSYCYDRYEIIHIKDKFLCIMTVTLYDGLEFYLFSFGIDEIDALQNCLTSKHKYEQLYDEKYDKEN